MNYFRSHHHQMISDLRYGGQLAGCRRLAEQPRAAAEDFLWYDGCCIELRGKKDAPAAASAGQLDAADLMTCFSGL